MRVNKLFVPQGFRLLFRSCSPLILLAALLLIGSCKGEEAPPVPISKMSNILFDLQVAEDYSIGNFADSAKQHGIEKNADTLAYYYALTLKHHAISTEQLEQALNWYYAHPVLMDSVYKRVIDKANKYKHTDVMQTTIIKEDSVAATPAQDSTRPVKQEPAMKDMERPERTALPSEGSSESEELKDIRKKNKDIKETLDKVKKQAQ